MIKDVVKLSLIDPNKTFDKEERFLDALDLLKAGLGGCLMGEVKFSLLDPETGIEEEVLTQKNAVSDDALDFFVNRIFGSNATPLRGVNAKLRMAITDNNDANAENVNFGQPGFISDSSKVSGFTDYPNLNGVVTAAGISWRYFDDNAGRVSDVYKTTGFSFGPDLSSPYLTSARAFTKTANKILVVTWTLSIAPPGDVARVESPTGSTLDLAAGRVAFLNMLVNNNARRLAGDNAGFIFATFTLEDPASQQPMEFSIVDPGDDGLVMLTRGDTSDEDEKNQFTCNVSYTNGAGASRRVVSVNFTFRSLADTASNTVLFAYSTNDLVANGASVAYNLTGEFKKA